MIRLIYLLPICILFLLFRTIMILIGLIVVPLLSIFYKFTTKSVWATINNAGKEILVWKYKLFWPWSNDEDGVVAGEEFLKMPKWFRMIYWSAIRNPANNLRFVKYLSVKINPKKVKFKANKQLPSLYDYDVDHLTFTTLTWQGLYSNFRVQFGSKVPEFYFKKLLFQYTEYKSNFFVNIFIFLINLFTLILNLIYLRVKLVYKIFRFWIGWKIYPHDQLGISPNDYRFSGAGFATQFKRIYPRN